MELYLKDFRRKHKLSQKEAAKSIGIDQRQRKVSADEILGLISSGEGDS